ncbi:MAG: response regulator [Elusimicrobiota bacterium]
MKKIMIVEDDPTTIKLLKFIMEKRDYNIVVKNNGKEAVESVQEEDPDLIIMDVMMPVMDGISATEKIKNNPSLAETPIIILSALGQEVEVMKGLKSGADGYIVKPFDSESLLGIIDEKITSAG